MDSRTHSVSDPSQRNIERCSLEAVRIAQRNSIKLPRVGFARPAWSARLGAVSSMLSSVSGHCYLACSGITGCKPRMWAAGTRVPIWANCRKHRARKAPIGPLAGRTVAAQCAVNGSCRQLRAAGWQGAKLCLVAVGSRAEGRLRPGILTHGLSRDEFRSWV